MYVMLLYLLFLFYFTLHICRCNRCWHVCNVNSQIISVLSTLLMCHHESMMTCVCVCVKLLYHFYFFFFWLHTFASSWINAGMYVLLFSFIISIFFCITYVSSWINAGMYVMLFSLSFLFYFCVTFMSTWIDASMYVMLLSLLFLFYLTLLSCVHGSFSRLVCDVYFLLSFIIFFTLLTSRGELMLACMLCYFSLSFQFYFT